MERSALIASQIATDSENPSVFAGIQFYMGGSLIQKFFLKTVADTQPRVRVMVREKVQISSFLWIPLSGGIPDFHGRRTFSSSQFRI